MCNFISTVDVSYIGSVIFICMKYVTRILVVIIHITNDAVKPGNSNRNSCTDILPKY